MAVFDIGVLDRVVLLKWWEVGGTMLFAADGGSDSPPVARHPLSTLVVIAK